MRYTNTTPFPTLCFESIGPEDQPVHTVVVRATTVIVPGRPLCLADEQLPLNYTDRYFGKPGASSLKYPNDLSPFKPMTDVILVATAYPPSKSARAWSVKVSVGQHRKSLVVTGTFSWEKSIFFGWQPTLFESSPRVPIRYESAFGGCLTLHDAAGESRVVDFCKVNPIGKGWLSALAPRLRGDITTFPAAQLYSNAADLPPVYGKEYAVEGLGAIAPTWASRQKYVGSCEVPEDTEAVPSSKGFDFRFFNSAHPDLILPYLKGDETVQLVNLTPDGRLDFQLPGHQLVIDVQSARQQENVVVAALLDTVIIEPDDMRATLVWRATVPVEPRILTLQARLIFNDKAGSKGLSHE